MQIREREDVGGFVQPPVAPVQLADIVVACDDHADLCIGLSPADLQGVLCRLLEPGYGYQAVELFEDLDSHAVRGSAKRA